MNADAAKSLLQKIYTSPGVREADASSRGVLNEGATDNLFHKGQPSRIPPASTTALVIPVAMLTTATGMLQGRIPGLGLYALRAQRLGSFP